MVAAAGGECVPFAADVTIENSIAGAIVEAHKRWGRVDILHNNVGVSLAGGDAPLADLTTHIVANYHEPLRQELPRLEGLLARVTKVHGAKAPELLNGLGAILGELSADLLAHMQKEEMVLFPSIRRLEEAGATGLPLDAPVRMMEIEHDRAGEMLASLRRVTADEPLEFDLNRRKAMCCGAGGGRMWMEERTGKRINVARFGQALAKAPQVIATACPYCAVMMEDAAKALDANSVRAATISRFMLVVSLSLNARRRPRGPAPA